MATALSETTRPSYRDIDGNGVLAVLGVHGRMELGVRKAELHRSADHPELGTRLEFTIGSGPSTSTVEVRLNQSDLFDIVIQQTRKRPGRFDWKRTVLAQLLDIDVENFRRVLYGAWCQVCTERKW